MLMISSDYKLRDCVFCTLFPSTYICLNRHSTVSLCKISGLSNLMFVPQQNSFLLYAFLCSFVFQASRAGRYNMAKVGCENSFSARQRLSNHISDDELAVIENGDSRSDIMAKFLKFK